MDRMPPLYHFTTKLSLHSIITDGKVLPNVVCAGSSSRNDPAVCLTSDTSPIGHGLPDGREVTPIEASRLQRCFFRNDRYFSHDHTFVRMTINIPYANEELVFVPTLFRECPEELFGLDVGGYLPCSTPHSASKQQIEMIGNLLKSGRLECKSKTWWYYFGEIPLHWVTEIGLRIGPQQYVSETRDVFLEQWKRELSDRRE